MAQRGGSAQFSYDFGIAIAQGTVNRVARLAGASLTLASAFYALKSSADKYVNTLRENTLRFGGVLSTMRAMEQAQDRLIKGQSYFSVDDQLKGMNELASVGIKVGKNLNWINKAAHATGMSYSQFAGMISSAIQGNSQALVNAGLMTQRATRMFDKYAAGTVMRQQAILNFVKNHKGLMNAIKNDFLTIQDQMRRLQAIWEGFLQSIMGKPNDPSSLYGQIVRAMGSVADSLAANMQTIRRYGYIIGHVLGWVVHQVGDFIVWLGRITKRAIESVWKVTDNYQEQARSIVVWLEFWKQTIVDYFQKYKGAIKTVIKLLLVYEALKYTFIIGRVAIASVMAYARAIRGLIRLQMAYMAFMGPSFGRTTRFFQSLAVWMPRPFRRAWVASGKFLGKTFSNCTAFGRGVQGLFRNIGLAMIAPFRAFAKIVPGLLSVAFNGIGAAASGPLAMFVGGAKGIHFKRLFLTFRSSFLGGFKAIFEGLKTLAAPIWGIFSSIFGPIFSFLTSGFRGIINMILNLPQIIGAAFNVIKGLWASLNATNPVGWVILAVTAVVLLYEKFETVRVLVNFMFKSWWEWIKLLWNIIYGAIIAVLVLIKKIWQFVNEWVVQPIIGFFKWTYSAIAKMWDAFKDSSVGKFINKYIVSPLKSLFEWIMKAIRWLLKGAANILGILNSGLAEEIRKGEKELGMNFTLAADGGKYDNNDGTNYIHKGLGALTDGFSFGKGNTLNGKINPNPLMKKDAVINTPVTGGNQSNGNGTNMTFSNGAIQINVQKGENIDENKLARKIKEVLKETARDDNMRGGTI